MGKLIEINGHIFGEWKVLERDLSKKGTYWICENIKTSDIKIISRRMLIYYESLYLEKQNRTWLVYKHTSPSNKVYVGITSSKNPNVRWGLNGNGYTRSNQQKRFSSAIKKYGWDNITHEILEYSLSYKDAQSKEKYYIKLYDSYKNGYNMTKGGEHSARLGKKHSEETKEKIRLSRIGTTMPLETRKKIGEANKKRICSEFTRQKISNSQKGICFSEEHKKKLSENHTDVSFGNNPNSQSVFFNNNIYTSIMECSMKNNIDYRTFIYYIQGVCGMPQSIYDKGIYYVNDDLESKYMNKRKISTKIKEVVCDNIIYKSVNNFSEINNLIPTTIFNYLKNKYPMPQKYIDRGLRYYNPETDKDLPIYENKD